MIIDIEIELWRPLENRTTHFDSRKKVLKGSLGVTLFLVVVYPNSNRDIKKEYTTTSYLFFKVNLHSVCSSNLGAHPTEILFGSNNCLKKKITTFLEFFFMNIMCSGCCADSSCKSLFAFYILHETQQSRKKLGSFLVSPNRICPVMYNKK